MRLPRASFSSVGIKWWWGFGLLICAPALALALLGLRAARAERIEREEQWRNQRIGFARLADASISTLIGELENQLRGEDTNQPSAQSASVPSEIPVFSLDRQGLLAFYREKVYFDQSGNELGMKPHAAEWSLRTEQLIERAETAEAQKRTNEALVSYRQIISAEPRLRDWAKICLARIRYQSGDARAKSELADPTLSGSEGSTPTGLPAALIACAYAEQFEAEARTDFIPLNEQTLENLRQGRWWLSFDERHFYDGELRGLLESAGRRTTDDARLGELAAISRIVRQSPPSRHDAATHSFERDEQDRFLLVWLPSSRNPDVWMGIAVAQHRLKSLLDSALSPVLSGQAGTASIRDAQGNSIWGEMNNTSSASVSEALRSIPGWEISFSGPITTAWMNQQLWLWYGFIALLVVIMMLGLAMTVRVVQREAELARMQNDFVASVSHEFKSPITGMRLLMERLASRARAPENEVEYRSAIDRELDRLERHVDRLLEAQKLQEGRKEYSFAPASLVEIAQSAVTDLRSQAEAKGISLQLQASGGIPAIQLDKAAIGGALENLIDNAIKYSPSGTRIDVLVRLNGDQVFADVCDQGIGIEPANLSRIFDKFYRGARGDQQSVRGSGLGLALVKAAVEAHGGTVEATSKRGEGSRFTISLPLERSD